MQTFRVISRIDTKSEKVIKGIHLEGWRVVGEANAFCKKYYDQGADEIILIDSVASLYNREKLINIIKKSAENLFIPLTAGGGIKSLYDAEELFKSGADKVAVNSAAVQNPVLIKEISKNFGSQSLVISIQVKKENNSWKIYFDAGRERTDTDIVDWINKCQELGAGEFMITSIDREGTGEGFDLDLIKTISEYSYIPVIISGGFGKPSDLDPIFKLNSISAVAIAKQLHNNSFKVFDIKQHILNNNVVTRI